MCLIIQRDPGFEIPFDKFSSAVKVNPDGFGLSYPDNGKLITLRDHNKPDAEKLYRLVNEELIDHPLLIHLRYTTAGETILRNSHPFPILEKEKDGVDLRMAHNGTLSKYKPLATEKSSESDTRRFVKEFVRPLFKRLAKGMEPEELLNDPFTKKLLEDQLNASSVLSFIDSEGHTLQCNATGNGGSQDEGWYYSNTYSFKEDHRTQVRKYSSGWTSYSYGSVVKPTKYNSPKQTTKTSGTTPKVDQGITKGVTRLSKSFDCTLFSDAYRVINPMQLTRLSDLTINKVISQGKGQMLIKELIFHLQQKDDEVRKLDRASKKLESDIKSLKEKMQ